MQTEVQTAMPTKETQEEATPEGKAGWVVLLLLLVPLCLLTVGGLWGQWRTEASLTHAPLIPPLAAGMLWTRREQLRQWQSASLPGLLVLMVSVLLYAGASWADVEICKPLGLIGMLTGVIGYLGGSQTFRAASGALGFLLLMVPWPETLTVALQFPLQQMSSAYAALLCGLCGLPVRRDGVTLGVVPDPDHAPIYRIVVSQQCSGLTSLLVLLTLGYLVAYSAPLALRWRVLLVALTVPLALFANALRLSLVLAAGAYHGATVALWVHDHEQPVLILLCGLGLLAARHALLCWTRPAGTETGTKKGDALGTVSPAAG